MRLVQFLILLSILVSSQAPAKLFNEYRIRLSLDDSLIIQETEEFAVEVKKQLILRFATIQVTPKAGNDFDLMLFFKCDTPDLALFNSPQKLVASLHQAALPYLPYVVETEVTVREFFWKHRHGYLTILTDRQLANKEEIPAGDFKYLTKGIVRITNDSVLGFSLRTNKIGTDRYDQLLAYVKSFVQE